MKTRSHPAIPKKHAATTSALIDFTSPHHAPPPAPHTSACTTVTTADCTTVTIASCLFDFDLQSDDKTEWDTERWKAKSRIGKANRFTEFDGVSSRHVGGSISTGQHRYKMAQAWGRDPTSSEVFERMYCGNRTGPPGSNPPTDPPVYVYPKAAIIHRRFRELKDDVEASQTPDSPPNNEATLWERSAGGRKKGRIFGWSTQDPRYAMIGECSSSSGGRSSGTASADELVALREQMTKMEEDARLREECYLAQLEIERKRNEELQTEQVRHATQLAEQLTLSQ
ncbi:hypothetical protein L6452_07187 [Arctium lappa]|uniref:Uncharacterized protein n=1 Tax=Arctium lappa TaxID=4217 RepID=A0ACB9ELS5_ARCLA|nr:hypothetical protein L6452_07187 [Arctium lappa]